MENANLPIPSAREPDEEARQPLQVDETAMPPPVMEPHKRKKNRPQDTHSMEKYGSKSSSNANDEPPLSQPPPGVSQRQRLHWLQQRRTTGLWVKCDECGRWRYLSHVLDRHELPREWYCRMNPDANAASCAIPEAPLRVRDEEDLIHSEYSAGSVVLARMSGFPWWPAMVDDCPDTEQFYWLEAYSDIPTSYNVVFFDSSDVDASRTWVHPKNLKPYGPNKNKKEFKRLLKESIFRNRLLAAVKQADDAESLPLPKRLSKYSFVSRFRGEIKKPKEIKRDVLKKFQNKLKRKYKILFESDSEDDIELAREENRKNNVILSDTPKRSKQIMTRTIISNKSDVIDCTDRCDGASDSTEYNNEEAGIKTQNHLPNAILKQPNSLSVQIGSTILSALLSKAMETFDNDTSKTYVPETDSEPESESVYAIEKELRKLQQRPSRDSADFDFV